MVDSPGLPEASIRTATSHNTLPVRTVILKNLQVADYADEKGMMEKAVRFLDREFLKSYELLLKDAARESARCKGSGENTILERISFKAPARRSGHTLSLHAKFL